MVAVFDFSPTKKHFAPVDYVSLNFRSTCKSAKGKEILCNALRQWHAILLALTNVADRKEQAGYFKLWLLRNGCAPVS